MPKNTRTRIRTPKPTWSYGGLTIATWQQLPDLVLWAQQSPQFRDLTTVLINERYRAMLADATATENRRLGRIEGYECALDVLRSLAQGDVPASKGTGDPTYAPDDDALDPATD